MLRISRRNGEGLWFNENIFMRVVTYRDGQVYIDIDAPRDVVVTRNEDLQRTGQFGYQKKQK